MPQHNGFKIYGHDAKGKAPASSSSSASSSSDTKSNSTTNTAQSGPQRADIDAAVNGFIENIQGQLEEHPEIIDAALGLASNLANMFSPKEDGQRAESKPEPKKVPRAFEYPTGLPSGLQDMYNMFMNPGANVKPKCEGKVPKCEGKSKTVSGPEEARQQPGPQWGPQPHHAHHHGPHHPHQFGPQHHHQHAPHHPPHYPPAHGEHHAPPMAYPPPPAFGGYGYPYPPPPPPYGYYGYPPHAYGGFPPQPYGPPPAPWGGRDHHGHHGHHGHPGFFGMRQHPFARETKSFEDILSAAEPILSMIPQVISLVTQSDRPRGPCHKREECRKREDKEEKTNEPATEEQAEGSTGPGPWRRGRRFGGCRRRCGQWGMGRRPEGWNQAAKEAAAVAASLESYRELQAKQEKEAKDRPATSGSSRTIPVTKKEAEKPVEKPVEVESIDLEKAEPVVQQTQQPVIEKKPGEAKKVEEVKNPEEEKKTEPKKNEDDIRVKAIDDEDEKKSIGSSGMVFVTDSSSESDTSSDEEYMRLPSSTVLEAEKAKEEQAQAKQEATREEVPTHLTSDRNADIESNLQSLRDMGFFDKREEVIDMLKRYNGDLERVVELLLRKQE